MSDTLDLTTVTDEPVESNVQVEITDAPETEEPDTEGTAEEPVVDEPVVSEEVSEPVEEVPDTEGTAEEPVVSEEVSEPVEEPPDTEGTAEDVSELVEEPVASEEPVVSEPVEEPLASEEPVVSEEPVAPIEQVAADIRSILTEVPTTTTPPASVETVETVETSEPVVIENLCSLKTLVDVLGKWSGNEIRRRQVEDLLKEGTEVDDNLDDIEKVVEVLQLWIGEGGSTFREHNHFKKLDEYTLSGESRNLSEEKKVEVLKTLIELTIDVSNRRKNNEEIQNIMDNLY